MITLSKRMEAIAALITEGNVVADVGTDHGYIPIYQLQQNRSPRAIAMDLREGPLARAREHVAQYALDGRIELRLSDGVKALVQGEADTIVVAGMGGELVMRILSDGGDVCRSAKELVLQPQSEIAAVRRYLRENGYRVTAEDMVFEDGKYYPMMRVVSAGEEGSPADVFEPSKAEAGQTVLEDLYGALLLENRHPVLAQYLRYQEEQLCAILEGLRAQPDSDKIRRRTEEIQQRLVYNRIAQKRMDVAADGKRRVFG